MPRRTITCTACRAPLTVSAAAEERGRMRCPECDELIRLPEEPSEGERLRQLARMRAGEPEDESERPRRRKKKASSGGRVVLVVLGLGALAAIVACAGVVLVLVRMTRSSAEPSPVPLMQARAGFRTNITSPQRIADGPAPAPPAGVKFQLLRYPSPAGQLAAYLTPDPRDGTKHPALVWAHGGFGGVGADVWEEGGAPMIFAEAGCVVMCPSWRGENDNPGQFELFYGEVDDAVAAVEYVAKLPYVDPKRIYMAGHSTGGTITLLTVEATDKLRAAFPFGGAPDLDTVLLPLGLGYGNTPFAWRDKKERRLRSAIDYIHHVRTPTFYFEGEESDDYLKDAQKMEEWARKGGAPVKAFTVKGGDHHDIVEPLCEMLAKKIKADAGPTCNIGVTPAEVEKAYDGGQ